MSSPPKKKVEKFGTQAEKAKAIFVFRNGDKHHAGVKYTLKANKTLAQVLVDLSNVVGVPTGAVRQIFTAEGKLVKTLEELEDQGKYVCAGAETFKKELQNPEEIEKPAEEPAKPMPPKKMTVSAYSSGKLEKFGTQTEKAKVIYAFRNGDKHHTGVKVTVHVNKFKTYDQLKEHLSKEVKLVTGPVMKLFTIDNKPINSMDELEDLGRYIAVGAEKVIKEPIPTALTKSPEELETPSKQKEEAPKVEKTKRPAVSAYSSGKIEKFGTQAEKAKVIYVFRNGDKHHTGYKLAVHTTKYKTWEQLLNAMSTNIGVPTGPVLKLFTPEGEVIKDFEGLVDNGRYICAGAEAFLKDLLSPVIFKEDIEQASAPPPARTSPSKPVVKKGPTVSAYSKGKPEKFGTQTEKGKIIYVFRNGDKHHAGVKITVHPTKFKTFDQLKDALNKQVGVPTGAVRQLFTKDGKSIKNLSEIEDEGRYVCAGAEAFKKELLSPAIFAEDNPSSESPKKKSSKASTAPSSEQKASTSSDGEANGSAEEENASAEEGSEPNSGEVSAEDNAEPSNLSEETKVEEQ